MVLGKFKTKGFWGVVLGVFLTASPASAFFLGNIEVKSKFGESFEATFEIHLDNKEGYEVALADAETYQKLGLVRPSLVNSLALEKPIESPEMKKIIRVYSKTPLFFPSFNLVVEAKHNGGVLLENFLVTVDFQQGLALNAVGKKKNKIEEPPEKPEVAKNENPLEERSLPEQEVERSPQKSEPVATVPAPKQGKNEAEPKIETTMPESQPVETTQVENQAIKPTPIINRLQSRRRLSGAIWATPKKVLPIGPIKSENKITPPSENAPEKSIEPEQKSVVIKSGDFIQLRRGEGLFSVARKLKIEEIHPSRIAVALWMKNIDKFIYGNIHGIEAGTRLEKEGVEKLAKKIDLQTAKNVLKNQAKEWKLTRQKTKKDEEGSPGVLEVPLPVERLDQSASIFDWLRDWKSSWEENDFEKHISFYIENSHQNSDDKNLVRERKKKLFENYPKPGLNLSPPNLILKSGSSWVVFQQQFFSKSLESSGTKEVEVVWDKNRWKIGEEKFYAEQHIDSKSFSGGDEKTGNSYPFLIHVSSHSRESEAFSISNKLRESGYDAYTAPVRISRGYKIFRVYVGRFATWDQARRLIKSLKGNGLGGHATVVPYPYALQVGQVKSMIEARQLLEKLRQKRISGFLTLSGSDSAETVQIRVLVGAFKKPGNAVWMIQKLKSEGLDFIQVNP